MKKFSLMLMFALSACGGGGAGGAGDAPPMDQAPAATPSATVDSFITAVLALVGVSDDSAEPAAIDAIAVTTPEDSQPVPLK